MDVLLVNPPFCSQYSHIEQFPPIGLAYVAAAIRDNNHSVSIIDASISKKQTARKVSEGYWYGRSLEEIDAEIRQHKFDILGIGCPFSTRFHFALEIAAIAKRIDSSIPVIIGGIHATAMPEEVLANKEFDYAVIGEGEQTIVELIDAIERGSPEDLREIDGIAYKADGEIFVNPRTSYIGDLDSLPPPARDLLDMEYYITSKSFRWDLGRGRKASIITSRGCPHRCTFCAVHLLMGRRYRARDPRRVVDEIDFLIKEYGIQELSFEDDNLTFERERIINICKELIGRNISIKWNTPGGVSVKALDEEVLRYMKAAGCVSINLAIESGDPEILNKVMKKGLSLEKVREVAHLAKELGFIVNAYFIIGMPGETKESVNKSIRFANSIPIDKLAVFFATPLPGTVLYDECVEKGYIPDDHCGQITRRNRILGDDPAIETPSLRRKELAKLRRKFFVAFLINKFSKNRGELLSLLASFLTDRSFRRIMVDVLKRYVRA